MQPRGVDTPLFLQSRIAMRNIPLTNRLLIGNGIALTLLVIIFAKVITAQSFVQSSDFLVLGCVF